MIKVIVKEDRNKNTVNVKYKSIKSDTLEHIVAMCSLYKEIKKIQILQTKKFLVV